MECKVRRKDRTVRREGLVDSCCVGVRKREGERVSTGHVRKGRRK